MNGYAAVCHYMKHLRNCSGFLCCLKTYSFNCAETEQGVAQAIIRSVVDFKRDPWPKVSDNAKDLVKKMLDPDPQRRLTAQQVLGSMWIFSM